MYTQPDTQMQYAYMICSISSIYLFYFLHFVIFTDPDPTIRVHRNSSTDQLFAGYDLTLTCFVDISNYSHIFDKVTVSATWFKDGVECNMNWDSRISVTPVALSTNGIYVTTLTFMPLILGDSGNYQCTANLVGSAGTSVANNTDYTALIVEGIYKHFMTLYYNGIFIIFCRFATDINSTTAVSS